MSTMAEPRFWHLYCASPLCRLSLLRFLCISILHIRLWCVCVCVRMGKHPTWTRSQVEYRDVRDSYALLDLWLLLVGGFIPCRMQLVKAVDVAVAYAYITNALLMAGWERAGFRSYSIFTHIASGRMHFSHTRIFLENCKCRVEG